MDRVPGTGALRIGKSLQFNGDMFTLCYLSCLHNEHIFFHQYSGHINNEIRKEREDNLLNPTAEVREDAEK